MNKTFCIIGLLLCFGLLSCQEKNKKPLNDFDFVPSEFGLGNDCLVTAQEVKAALKVFARIKEIHIESHVLFAYFNNESKGLKITGHAICVFRDVDNPNIIYAFVNESEGSIVVNTKGNWEALYVAKSLYAYPIYAFYVDDILVDKKIKESYFALLENQQKFRPPSKKN